MKLLKQLAIVALVCYGQSILAMGSRTQNPTKMNSFQMRLALNKLHGIAVDRDEQGNSILIESHKPHASLGLATDYLAILDELRALKAKNPVLYNEFIQAAQDTEPIPKNICDAMADYPRLRSKQIDDSIALEHILKYNKPR